MIRKEWKKKLMAGAFVLMGTLFLAQSVPLAVNDPLKGDVNGDGKVNRADRIYFARALAGWSGYDMPGTGIGDFTKDDKVNRADRIYLARALAKWKGYSLDGSEVQDESLVIAMTEENGFNTEKYYPREAFGGVVIVSDTESELYGAMDYDGNLILPCEYDGFCSMAENGHFALYKGTSVCVFSPKGKLICTIDDAETVETSSDVISIIRDASGYHDSFYEYAQSVEYRKYDGTILKKLDKVIECSTFHNGTALYREDYDSREVKVLKTDGTVSTIKLKPNGVNSVWAYMTRYSSLQDGYFTMEYNIQDGEMIIFDDKGNPVSGLDFGNQFLDNNKNKSYVILKNKGDGDFGEYGFEEWAYKVPYVIHGTYENYDDNDFTIWDYYKDGTYHLHYGSKIVVRSQGKFLLVDMAKLSTTKTLPTYDYIGINEGKYWLVSQDGKWGYADHDGKLVKLYDDATPFYHGNAFILDGGNIYLVDEELNRLENLGAGQSTSPYAGDLYLLKDAEGNKIFYLTQTK